MTQAILVSELGGPEQLVLTDRACPVPEAGQLKIRQTAIGLNFIDVYFRTGLYPAELPFVPGMEGVGQVLAVGEGVSEFAVGDRVAYNGLMGAYAEERVVPADKVVPVPDGISDEQAAASMLKGLTAYYLLHMTWPLKAGETILFHAAAGGVGLLACQWANAIGARVIGTVGSAEKAELALANGCDAVINYREQDFAEEVARLTDGKGVDVVYDSVGKDTFESSLACLRPRGLMVSFGNATGPVSVPDLGLLARLGSLYVTRPTLFAYLATKADLRAAAAEMFAKFADGTLKAYIGQRFKLADAADAHRALESRATVGSTILLP